MILCLSTAIYPSCSGIVQCTIDADLYSNSCNYCTPIRFGGATCVKMLYCLLFRRCSLLVLSPSTRFLSSLRYDSEFISLSTRAKNNFPRAPPLSPYSSVDSPYQRGSPTARHHIVPLDKQVTSPSHQQCIAMPVNEDGTEGVEKRFEIVEDLEHSVRKTALTLFSNGSFDFKRTYSALDERSSPYKGDERVPNHTNRTVDSEEESSERGGEWSVFLVHGNTMVLQIVGDFTVSWPDGRGRPLTVPRCYSIRWDPVNECPAQGANWTLSASIVPAVAPIEMRADQPRY